MTLNNIMKAVEQGIVNKTTNKRMQELEQQIDEIDKQMLVERSKTNTKISEQEIREFYKEALLQEPLILIDILIKEIKVFNDRFEITFNSPIIKSPDTKQGSFLTLKTKMKKYIQNKPITYTDFIIDFYI